MTKIKPLSPHEAKKKTKPQPDFVIETFNELISQNLRGKTARVSQEEAVVALVAKMLTSVSSLDEDESKAKEFRSEIFKRHYLDVEDNFRDAGWKVYFDKPGYCESYEAYYEFTKP